MDYYMVNFYYKLDEEYKKICWFKCKAFSEMIRFLEFCKQNNVEFWPHDSDEHIDETALEKLNGIGAFVDDYNVIFGSDDVIQCIEVYLE